MKTKAQKLLKESLNFTPIYWNGSRWHQGSKKAFETVEAAREAVAHIFTPVNVVHVSFLDCLDVWPTPQEQKEAGDVRLSDNTTL